MSKQRITISLSLPVRINEMIEEMAKQTYSTKTKIVIDAIRKEYSILKNIGTDIGKQIEKEEKRIGSVKKQDTSNI